MIPGDHICQDFLIGMADVWRGVRIIDRGGDKVSAGHGLKLEN
jgi:hypothetical protein